MAEVDQRPGQPYVTMINQLAAKAQFDPIQPIRVLWVVDTALLFRGKKTLMSSPKDDREAVFASQLQRQLAPRRSHEFAGCICR
jgi:hypothetical protein